MHVDSLDLVCILFSSSPSFLPWWQLPGSLYFLVLMACAHVHPQVHLLSGPSCGGLARLIHWPTGMTFSLKGKSCVTTDFHDRFSLWDPHQRRNYSCNCLYEKDLPSYCETFLSIIFFGELSSQPSYWLHRSDLNWHFLWLNLSLQVSFSHPFFYHYLALLNHI